jgi:hypothetical protein
MLESVPLKPALAQYPLATHLDAPLLIHMPIREKGSE